jgi:hypothetical protein
MLNTALGSFALVATMLAACSSDDSAGQGSLRIKISGEEAALTGYPVQTGDHEIAFSDGWELAFQKILVSLTDFNLQAEDGDDAELAAGPVVADLHLGQPRLWSFAGVPARRWDRVGFTLEPPTRKSKAVNEIDDADVTRMADEGYAILIQATAKKDDRTVQLDYGFPFTVVSTRCENGMDRTDGIVVANGAVNEAQVTIHLDHLFFDSFAVDDAGLHFEPMAAVAPASGPLTLADLSKQANLSDLKDPGGAPLDLAYDPGSVFNPVPKTLEDYVIDAATTIGHWNGEGHCAYTRK